MMAPRTLPRKRNRTIENENHARSQVVFNGFHGELDQVGTIEEGTS